VSKDIVIGFWFSCQADVGRGLC